MKLFLKSGIPLFVCWIVFSMIPQIVLAEERPVLIYLVGFAGTGKYTIAKEMAKQGYKVVDNHLINNPIFSLLDNKDLRETPEGTTDKIDKIRDVVFHFIEEDQHSSYILTNQLVENAYHRGIYQKVLNTAKKQGAVFVPVKLLISAQERAKRIVQVDRQKNFKITDVQEAYLPKKMLSISHQNLLELEVSKLTAQESAERILRHVARVRMGAG